MLRQLAASRWVKAALLLLVLGFCGYGLFVERVQVVADMRALSWYAVVGAFLAVLAALWCLMLSWRALLADLGSPLPLRPAARIMFVAQLGKYVPGSVWAAGAQVELARTHNVPRTRSATAAIMGMQVSLTAALLTAAVTLPLSSPDAVRRYWWALVVAAPALVGLYPPLMRRLLDRVLRLARRPAMEGRISAIGVARSFGWAVLGWVFLGIHIWLLVADVTGKGLEVLPLATGAFALAWSVGFILIPFPGGAGPRDVALALALAPAMASGAGGIALASRVLMTLGDLVWASAGFLIGRSARTRGHLPGSAPGTATSALDDQLDGKRSYT